jgi:cytochrome c oxidase subunit 4
MSHHAHDDHHGELGHIVPRAVYLKVFLSLLALTVVTVGVAHIDVSPGWNVTIALAVATVKAVLVLLFFMHLKYESKVIWAYVAFPIVLVFVLIGGVYSDNPLRVHTEPVAVHKQQ